MWCLVALTCEQTWRWSCWWCRWTCPAARGWRPPCRGTARRAARCARRCGARGAAPRGRCCGWSCPGGSGCGRGCWRWCCAPRVRRQALSGEHCGNRGDRVKGQASANPAASPIWAAGRDAGLTAWLQVVSRAGGRAQGLRLVLVKTQHFTKTWSLKMKLLSWTPRQILISTGTPSCGAAVDFPFPYRLCVFFHCRLTVYSLRCSKTHTS